MKAKKIVLLMLILAMLIGVSYATEVSNDTTATDTHEPIVKDNSNTKIADTNIKEDNNKEIVKKTIVNQTTKTASKTYDVTDFNTLENALTSDTYKTVTVNLKSNITLNDDIDLNENIIKLTINGNGKTINGNNDESFLYINENNVVNINNLIIRNCLGYAITNYGSLTLTNSVFDNNNGVYYIQDGGETYTVLKSYYAQVHNYEASIVVNNCTFKNSLCYIGSAISAIRSEVNITKSNFINNTEKNYGGTVFNWQSYLNIKESTFKNNHAYLGGAVFNYWGFGNITKSVFEDNNATEGGAIRNHLGDLNLTNNTFINNQAENVGGAIGNMGERYSFSITTYDDYGRPKDTTHYNDIYGNMIIDKNIFINNSAIAGGAISTNITDKEGLPEYSFKTSQEGVVITNNEFMTNTAEQGGAITIRAGTKNTIEKNTFSKNEARNSTIAINSKGDDDIQYNKEDTSTLFNSIYTNTNTESIIQYNTFKDKIITKITINNLANTKYGNNIKISGTLIDENNDILENTYITLNLNGKTVTVKTNTNGIFTYETKANKVGTNNITASYEGNNNYNTTSTKATFTVTKQDLNININKITTTKYNENVTITGKFTDKTGKILANTNLKLNINKKTVTVKTNTNGIFTYKTKVSKVGTNNVTVSYAGNTNYNAKSTKTTFTGTKQNLKITVSNIKVTGYGSNVTIKGTFMDKTGKILGNSIIRINLNGKTYKVKANPNGVFIKSIKTNKLGTNNITISYPGNKNYNQISIKKTFKVVKNNVTVSITSLKQVGKTRNITITGKFTDKTGNILKNSQVTVKINNKRYTAKTNNKGIYTLTKAANKGSNTITVGYAGNKNYNKYTSAARKITIS